MFTSSADVFRTRQAVRDLLEVVRTHRSAVSRLGATGTDRSELVSITASGCLIPDAGTRAYSTLMLAAAMPEEDFNGFIAATAILLADRLQDGGGRDNLYWNYEAFRDHFRLADPPVRAALMNGFRLGHRLGRVHLPEVPPPDICLTRGVDDVLLLLRASGESALADTVEADPSATAAGQAWSDASAGKLSHAARAGFRFLYERPESLVPAEPDEAQLISWD